MNKFKIIIPTSLAILSLILSGCTMKSTEMRRLDKAIEDSLLIQQMQTDKLNNIKEVIGDVDGAKE